MSAIPSRKGNSPSASFIKRILPLAVFSLSLAGTGCVTTVNPVDLRVTPAPPPHIGQPVYINKMTVRKDAVRQILPEGRSAEDLIREALTDTMPG